MHGLLREMLRIMGILPVILQSRLYRLYYHDGIIHHGTNHQYEGEECQHVQGETDGVDHSQGGYQ